MPDMRSINVAKHPEDEVCCSKAKLKEHAERARRQGQADERERIFKLFHDWVGPKLLVAVFTAQIAKEELEAQGLKESATVAKVGDRLVEAIDCLVAILDPEEAVIEEIQGDSLSADLHETAGLIPANGF
jgi:hypothetical protein